MNLGETLSKLTKGAQQAAGQAQKAVVDNKQHINGAVDKFGSVADKTTGGRFSDRIAKAGEQAKGMVNKLDRDGDGVVSEAEAAAGGAQNAAGAEGASDAGAEGVFSGEANQAQEAADSQQGQ